MPCAGPILAAITVVGATHRVGLTAVILTAAFAAGTAVPLLALAVAGSELTQRIGAIRQRAPQVRRVGGAVLVVIAVAIAFNVFGGLQRDIPGYTTRPAGLAARSASSSTGSPAPPHTSLTSCNANASTLVNCGSAPNFTGITTWLNTPGGKPLSLAALRGKVVLVDFWTYSCINCQRTLPHVEAWYQRYAQGRLRRRRRPHPGVRLRARGLQRAGRRPPRSASTTRSPIDDNYGTWNAYDNEYWPADYLIDAQGDVRHVALRRGRLLRLPKQLIRQLLTAAHPGV